MLLGKHKDNLMDFDKNSSKSFICFDSAIKHLGHARSSPSRTAKVNPNESVGQAYTNFSCGHFASRYAAKKLGCDEIHMYGFDSLFDWNMRSYSDLVLNSDRSNTNNHRLIYNWRPVWRGIFNEFKDTQFVLYHSHNDIKIKVPENVEIRTKN